MITVLSRVVLVGLAGLLVLAGLKIWKFYVNFVGAFVGLILLGMVASVFGAPQLVTFSLSLVGAVVGAWISWPLQKIVVFVAAGGALAVVGMAIFQLVLPPLVVWFIGFVLLVAGGWLSLKLLQPLLVVSMAVAGAWLTNHALGGVCPLQAINEGAEGLQAAIEALGPPFIMISIIFSLYALMVQLWLRPDKAETPVSRERRIVIRRAGYVGVGFMLLDLFLHDAFGIVSVSGFSPFLWPVAATMLGYVAAYILRPVSIRSLQWLVMIVAGPLIFITMTIVSFFMAQIMSLSIDPGLTGAGLNVWWTESGDIIPADPVAIALFFIFHMALLPGVMIFALRVKTPTTVSEEPFDA